MKDIKMQKRVIYTSARMRTCTQVPLMPPTRSFVTNMINDNRRSKKTLAVSTTEDTPHTFGKQRSAFNVDDPARKVFEHSALTQAPLQYMETLTRFLPTARS